MDVDIHGPSVPTLLGISGTLDVDRGSLIIPKEYNDNLHVVSMESLLKDPDQAVLWRGPMKTSAIRQFISDVQWGELDFLVVDSPPGTGDEPMTVLKTIPDALCVVVTTPQEVSLSDVRKSINFLQYAQANVLGVVENMSGLVCPHCHKDIDLFKKGGGKALAEKYGLDFLGGHSSGPGDGHCRRPRQACRAAGRGILCQEGVHSVGGYHRRSCAEESRGSLDYPCLGRLK